jgi:hypothetical protein
MVGYVTVEDGEGAHILSRNVVKQLPIYIAQYPQKSEAVRSFSFRQRPYCPCDYPDFLSSGILSG